MQSRNLLARLRGLRHRDAPASDPAPPEPAVPEAPALESGAPQARGEGDDENAGPVDPAPAAGVPEASPLESAAPHAGGEGDNENAAQVATQDNAPEPRAQPLRSAAGRRGAVAAVGVTLLVGGGGVGAVWGDDLIEDAPSQKPDVANYMARAGYEWATIERLARRADNAKGRYRCAVEGARLEPLVAELRAIGPPDDELHRRVEVYVNGLQDVVRVCAGGTLTGPDVARRIAEAQRGWNQARLRALELGWKTPCALHRTVSDCLEG